MKKRYPLTVAAFAAGMGTHRAILCVEQAEPWVLWTIYSVAFMLLTGLWLFKKDGEM